MIGVGVKMRRWSGKKIRFDLELPKVVFCCNKRGNDLEKIFWAKRSKIWI